MVRKRNLGRKLTTQQWEDLQILDLGPQDG
jgi:hypothetical protein